MATLNDLIRQEASKNVGIYNLKKEPQRTLCKIHHDICKALVKYADENNFPMGVLVYIAVGTNAHRPMVFERGYKRIDMAKTDTIIHMADIVAKRLGEKYRTNDKVIHALSRFYEVHKGKPMYNILKHRLDMIDKVKLSKMQTAKDFAKLVFDENAEYTKGGYLKVIKL